MIDTGAIRFVYFDLDDTILDHARAEKLALLELHQQSHSVFEGRSFEAVLTAYREINPIVWKLYSEGSFTKQQAKVGRFTQLLEKLNIESQAEDELLAEAYLSCYANHWSLISGAMEGFLKIARARPVGILTNGFSEVQRAKLKQFPQLENVSSAVIISEEVGVLKPDPALFEHAAAVVGVPAETILYVGDSLHSDVGGGIGAGWKVAWFSEQSHEHEDVWSFSDWSLLIGLLDGDASRAK